MRQPLGHCTAAAGFAGLAIVWSYPLIRDLSTHLPGSAIGDNSLFLWNFWWMRMALASGTDFFRTPYLFAPVGVDLTLHTHTAFSAWLGATAFKNVPVVTALNATTLAALALNGFCAYLLAWRVTRVWAASVIGGLIFATSPYLAAHLNGHFNLTSAWTIPLFALALPPALAGSKKWGVLCGLVLAVTVYTDYYYLVYELAWALCVVALTAGEWSLSARVNRSSSPWFVAVGVAIIADLVVMAVIASTGGFGVRLGPVRVSMHETYNPLQLFWALAGIAVLVRVRPRIHVRARPTWSWVRSASPLVTMLGVLVVAAAPLVWKGWQLIAHGQYVTQQYYWRSAPTGVDAASLFFGNPFHGVWGAAVRRLYTVGSGINVIECGGWIGVAPIALLVYALVRRRDDSVVRQWAVLGAVFLVWALGPHLMVAGRDTGMILPETLLRYVPIASNARVPGRAMVMVYLAIAILAAIAAADWRAPRARRLVVLSAIGLFVFADFLAAPFPMASIECPSIYRVLRDRPERGALAELPLGFGDGLMGELTAVDHRVFVCQLTHQRPLVGGVLARLPPNVLPAYEADPLLAGWLRLSGAREPIGGSSPLPDRALSGDRLKADGIAFVMLNRETASPRLREYVERVMPLTLIAREGSRALYRANW